MAAGIASLGHCESLRDLCPAVNLSRIKSSCRGPYHNIHTVHIMMIAIKYHTYHPTRLTCRSVRQVP